MAPSAWAGRRQARGQLWMELFNQARTQRRHAHQAAMAVRTQPENLERYKVLLQMAVPGVALVGNRLKLVKYVKESERFQIPAWEMYWKQDGSDRILEKLLTHGASLKKHDFAEAYGIWRVLLADGPPGVGPVQNDGQHRQILATNRQAGDKSFPKLLAHGASSKKLDIEDEYGLFVMTKDYPQQKEGHNPQLITATGKDAYSEVAEISLQRLLRDGYSLKHCELELLECGGTVYSSERRLKGVGGPPLRNDGQHPRVIAPRREHAYFDVQRLSI
eukprot:TRINITY_DN82017_c0_g1_i1.p1 TRINITY_DN82017_c0_g1~~TRINITY_DN82017_c0_g1_i1.p1  ORF type:complete len:275 (+),score=48.42 TRINITY_DN82017_c0_g1_i1:107-931(+)